MWINIISIYNFILTKYSVLYMLENCSDTCDIILVFLKFISYTIYSKNTNYYKNKIIVTYKV